MHPWHLLSTFIYFSCVTGTFRKLPSTFLVSVGPSESVPYGCWTYCQLYSTFRAAAGLSVNFHQCGTFHIVASTFCVAVGLSLNFPCIRRTFCKVVLTFRADEGPFVNISCRQGTFRQIFVRPQGILSTVCASQGPSVNFCAPAGPSVNFLYGRGTFRQLPLTFCTSVRTSVNTFLRLPDLQSTSVDFLCVCRTLH